jgi:hypothetical protein
LPSGFWSILALASGSVRYLRGMGKVEISWWRMRAAVSDSGLEMRELSRPVLLSQSFATLHFPYTADVWEAHAMSSDIIPCQHCRWASLCYQLWPCIWLTCALPCFYLVLSFLRPYLYDLCLFSVPCRLSLLPYDNSQSLSMGLFVAPDGHYRGWLAALLCCIASVTEDEHPAELRKTRCESDLRMQR